MDMPLQHASRNVLARMKRGSNGDAVLEIAGAHSNDNSGVSLRKCSSWAFRAKPKPISRVVRFREDREPRLDGRLRVFDVDNAGSYALDEKVDAETISDRATA